MMQKTKSNEVRILVKNTARFFSIFFPRNNQYVKEFIISQGTPVYENRHSRLRLKCDDTRAETRFCLPAKRTSPFKSAGASVQSTTDSRGVRISGSNAGYTMFWASVEGTGYQLHSPVSPSIPSRASPCAITFQLDSTNKHNLKYELTKTKQRGSV